MEDLTFIEQIRLFRSSEIITGPHGAALSFSIFCEPRTIIYEIMKDTPNKAHFADIAKKLELTFFSYAGVSEWEEEHSNMKIDKNSYLESLREIINLKLRET
jgi:capsular polysaccharide biosynthesis protein